MFRSLCRLNLWLILALGTNSYAATGDILVRINHATNPSIRLGQENCIADTVDNFTGGYWVRTTITIFPGNRPLGVPSSILLGSVVASFNDYIKLNFSHKDCAYYQTQAQQRHQDLIAIMDAIIQDDLFVDNESHFCYNKELSVLVAPSNGYVREYSEVKRYVDCPLAKI